MNYLVNSFPETVTIELSVATSNLNATFEWYAFNQGPFSGVQTTEGNERISKFVKDFTITEAIKSNGYCKLIAPSKAFVLSNPVELNVGLDAVPVTISESVTADSSGVVSISVPYPSQGGPFYGNWEYSTQEPPINWSTIPNQEVYVIGQPFQLKRNFSELTGYKYLRFVISTSVDSAASNECKLYDSPVARPTISIAGSNPSNNVYFETDIAGTEIIEATASSGSIIQWYTGDKILPENQLTLLNTTGSSIELKSENVYKKYVLAKATNSEGSTFSNPITVLYESKPVIISFDPSSQIIPQENGNYTSTINFENTEKLQVEKYDSNLRNWVNHKNEIDVANVRTFVFQDNISSFEFPWTSIRYKLTNANGTIYSRDFSIVPSFVNSPQFVTQPADVGLVSENVQTSYTFQASAINSFNIYWESTSNTQTGPWIPVASGTNTITIPISTLAGEAIKWYRAKAFNIDQNSGQTNWAYSNAASLGISAPPVIWGISDPIPDGSSDFTLSIFHLRGNTITWQTRPNGNEETQWINLTSYNIQRIYNPTYKGNANSFTAQTEFRCVVTNNTQSITSDTVQLDLDYSNDVPNNGTQEKIEAVLPVYYSGGIPLTLATNVTNAQSITWQYRIKKPTDETVSEWTSIGYKNQIEIPGAFYETLPLSSTLEFRCLAGNAAGSTIVKEISTYIRDSYVTMKGNMRYDARKPENNLAWELATIQPAFGLGNDYPTEVENYVLFNSNYYYYNEQDKIQFGYITQKDIAVFILGRIRARGYSNPFIGIPKNQFPFDTNQNAYEALRRDEHLQYTQPEVITWQGSPDGLLWTDIESISCLNYNFDSTELHNQYVARRDDPQLSATAFEWIHTTSYNDKLNYNRFPLSSVEYNDDTTTEANYIGTYPYQYHHVNHWAALEDEIHYFGTDISSTNPQPTSIYDFYGNFDIQPIYSRIRGTFLWTPKITSLSPYKYLRYKFWPNRQPLDNYIARNQQNPNHYPSSTLMAISAEIEKEMYSTPILVVKNKNTRIPKIKQQPASIPVSVRFKPIVDNIQYEELPNFTAYTLTDITKYTVTSPINLRANFSNPSYDPDAGELTSGWQISSIMLDSNYRPQVFGGPGRYEDYGIPSLDVSFKTLDLSAGNTARFEYSLNSQENRENMYYKTDGYAIFPFKIRPISYNNYGTAYGKWIDVNIISEIVAKINKNSNQIRANVVFSNALNSYSLHNLYYPASVLSSTFAPPTSAQWQMNLDPASQQWVDVGSNINWILTNESGSWLAVARYATNKSQTVASTFNQVNGSVTANDYSYPSMHSTCSLIISDPSLISVGGELNPAGKLSFRLKYWDTLCPPSYSNIITISN